MMIRSRLAQTTGVRRILETPVHGFKTRSIRRWAAASVMLMASAGTVYFYSFRNDLKQSQLHENIAPAKSLAILTLADGHRIILSDEKKGKLASEPGVNITKADDGKLVYSLVSNQKVGLGPALINLIEIPRGGKYLVHLPDGTKVWLNSASSLRYPSRFTGKQRRVELSGEAYFEVAKVRLPFLVITKKQTIEVLGTHFNVNSYADEGSVKTTLLEGSVHVVPMKGQTVARNGDVMLKPGEQSVLQGGILKVRAADIGLEMAWKNGEFIFTNNDFRAEMRKIGRWYDVDIVYDDSAPEHVDLDGFVSSEKNISAVLKLIALTGKVHFKMEGRRVIVTK